MPFLSLYRKYRPETFVDLVGQDYVVQTLRNALKNNRIAHAYLFTGPRGTGKTSTAKVFARTLNCQDESTLEPCGLCDNCKKIASGQSLDVIEIDAASNRGIDEIRDLREKVKFYPSEGNYKVYIIDEVHMLTKGAFNALLKTLEEPPENVVFILATTEPHQVISTILSRCQRFDFSLLSIKDIEARLSYICKKEEVEFEKDGLNLIAHSSNGGMRDAISILDQAISFTDSCITADKLREMLGKIEKGVLSQFIKCLSENNTSEALELINELIERGKGVAQFVSDLIEHIRQLLLVRECGLDNELIEYPPSRLKLLEGESKLLDSTELVRVLNILTGIEKDLKFSNQSRLILEMGLVKMTSPETDNSIEGLKARVAQLEYKLRQSESVSDPVERTDSSKKKSKNHHDKKEKNVNKEIETGETSKNKEQEKPADIKKENKSSKRNESRSDNTFSMKDIADVWPVILKKVKDEDIKTNAYLKEGKPGRVANGTIYIEFPENKKFHRNGAKKKYSLVKRVISRVLQKNCRLEFVLEGEYNVDNSGQKEAADNKKGKKKLENDEFLSNVIEMFDGKVIEARDDILKD